MNWREIPFVRLCIPLALGILTSFSVHLWIDTYCAMVVQGGTILFLVAANSFKIKFVSRWYFGAGLNVFLFLFGCHLSYFHHGLHGRSHFQSHIKQQNYILGKIKEINRNKKSYRLIVKVLLIGSDSMNESSANGQLLVYLPANGDLDPYVGDWFLAKGHLRRIAGPSNPYSFDFSRYMSIKNTHHRLFIQEGNWRILSNDQDFSIVRLAHQIQNKFLKVLQTYLPESNENAVGAALILGHKDELTKELKSAYSDTGAMHVLAVSGLHVGLIYLGLSSLLAFLNRANRLMRILNIFIQLGGVWSFALITGAAPSVLRASAMLSFLIVGRALHREASIYNVLAASAFVLLCINPFTLADVGFQLSYSALLGIIYFQPKIYGLFYIANTWLDYLWKLLSVGISAQLATLPVSLFYFQQFPLFFWLSGLVVVPAATLILGLGFLVFSLHSVPFLPELIGKVLFYVIHSVNTMIFWIQSIPYGKLEGIFFPVWVLVPLFLCFFFVILTIEYLQLKWGIAALFCLLVIGIWNLSKECTSLKQRRIVIYSVRNGTVIDFFNGQTAFAFAPTKLAEDQLRYVAGNFRQWSRINHQRRLDQTIGEINFHSIRIVIVDGYFNRDSTILPGVDYLLLRENPRISLRDLESTFNPGQFIFDGSNSRYKTEQWNRECQELGLRCIDIQTHGALVIEATP